MNALFWWSLGGFAVSVAGMLGVWAYDVRNRRASTVRKIDMVELTVHIDDVNSLTYVTAWPVKADDLAALRVLVARKVGPVWTGPVLDQFIAAIAAREAAELDADLADLGGAA